MSPTPGLIAVVCLLIGTTLNAAEESKIPLKVIEFLSRYDADKDKQISQAEFLAAFPKERRAARDFGLCDWNRDEVLNSNELASVPLLVGHSERSNVPFVLTEEFVPKAFRPILGHREELSREDGRVPAGEFCEMLTGAYDIGQVRQKVETVDVDKDGNVSHSEAKRCVDMLWGVRSIDGRLLVYPNGTIFKEALFRRVDKNGDRRLSKEEFKAHSALLGWAEPVFKEADRDHDDVLSFDECRNNDFFLFDVINQFRDFDADLSGSIDWLEWKKKLPPEWEWCRTAVFKSADRNGNGSLSFNEFRLSLYPLPVWDWTVRPTSGENKDIIYLEDYLALRPDEFTLLREWAYHGFDREGIDFPFRTLNATGSPGPFWLHLVDLRTNNWQPIWRHPEDLDCVQLSVSPDGQRFTVLCQRRPLMGTQLWIGDFKTREALPTETIAHHGWTADGTSLLTDVNAGPTPGTWAVSLDGAPRKQLGEGQHGQISPDGTRLAQLHYRPGINSMFEVISLMTGKSVSRFSAAEAQAVNFDRSFCWAPDGKRLCVLALKQNRMKFKVAIVDAAGAELGYKERLEVAPNVTRIAWSPDGKRILFGQRDYQNEQIDLLEFDPDQDGEPVPVRWHSPKMQVRDFSYCPDGVHIVVVARERSAMAP